MRKVFRQLKKIWIFSLFRRLYRASKYFNYKYLQILKWGLTSREYTNFTYYLTEENKSYLAHTISIVTGKTYSEILSYFEEIENDTELKKSIFEAIKLSSEGRYADNEIRFGRRIGWYAFVRALKPRTVIETGIDKGLGSVLLCSALLRNKADGHEGRYYGTDIDPKAGYFLKGKYTEVGEVLYGDSIASLKRFNKEIDILINDSDHSADYEYNEYVTIEPLINVRTVILGDNAHCTGKLAQFSVERKRKFLFFQEQPKDHWYPGAGIGISYT